MELLAAIDILEGGAVRLVRGEFDRSTGHGDPVDLARRYLEGGARWLHVVDLDAARSGDAANRKAVLAVADLAHEAGARVEVGGGVRGERDVDALVGAGIDRVVLGTAAVEDPASALECARRHPGRVAIGIDYRRRAGGDLEAAVRGWVAGSGRSVEWILAAFDGEPVGAVVVTAIDRDGTLGGPDTDGLSRVLDATALPVVASGGVAGMEDIGRLAGLRSSPGGRSLAGVVVGKALADGRLSVEEAIAACAPSG